MHERAVRTGRQKHWHGCGRWNYSHPQTLIDVAFITSQKSKLFTCSSESFARGEQFAQLICGRTDKPERAVRTEGCTLRAVHMQLASHSRGLMVRAVLVAKKAYFLPINVKTQMWDAAEMLYRGRDSRIRENYICLLGKRGCNAPQYG